MTGRPCGCWLTPEPVFHDGHCCMRRYVPDACGRVHGVALIHAVRAAGGSRAWVDTAPDDRARLFSAAVDRLYPEETP